VSEEKKQSRETINLSLIKNQLLERKKELDQELGELYKPDNPGEVQDIGDQALSSSMETIKISLQDAELEEYNRIVKALQMIDEGSYGICVDCGQPISEKRLKLYPNATRCLKCQERLEETKKEI
jgi:DnaK suppressor protein